MRVLILSPELPPRDLLGSLVALGVEPVVPRPRGDTEIDGLIRYERVGARGDTSDPLDLRWSRRDLRTLVRDTRPDLLHLVGDPWTPTAETGAAAARDLKLPYVVVGQSSRGGARGITARWQAKRVRDGAAGLAGIVRSALDHLIDDTLDVPVAVIPPANLEIPGHLADSPPPERPVFGLLGRMVSERGVDLALDALAEVYGDWRLRIAGTGPVQVDLEAQAQRLGLSARIEWLGAIPREDIPAFYQTVDVMLAPSRTTPDWVEPVGHHVAAAMARGVPAVVSRSGALPDVVGDAGLIIDEGDRPALSRALQGLVDDPARCRTLGIAARRRAIERYGHGPIAERLVHLWRQVLRRS